jgi:cytochrome d ubiquinol oxidase subunit II
MMVNAIGPFWDANEVWLITAGGAMFAAFPNWYATMFSGFYLPLVLMLVALIARGAAFEFRSKHETGRWRGVWDGLIFVGSLVPALLWGVALGNLLLGVPIDPSMTYVGGFFNLLNPYSLAWGLTTLIVFTLHGAIFLSLRIEGELGELAMRAAQRIWPFAVVIGFFSVGVGYFVTDMFARLGVDPGVITMFIGLYPRVMVSSLGPSLSLTIYNAASSPYTLRVMSLVAISLLPFVLFYQGWSYWTFRKRISGDTKLEY